MTDREREFLRKVMLFLNECAGEGIGQEISGAIVWSDDLMLGFMNEGPIPDWVPEEIVKDWTC